MSIRERLYPAAEQTETLLRHCRDARYVWNLGLEQRQMWAGYDQSSKPRFNLATQMRELSAARKETWLGEGSSVVQQGALRDLDRAYQNWFKNPKHFSAPTWRKAGIDEGFVIRDLSVRRINKRWGQVQVPKVGWVRFRISRNFDEHRAATSARVTLKAGRWHVSLTAKPAAFERDATSAVVGIDRGVKNTLATSDGKFEHAPSLTPGEQKRHLVLQQRMSRQVKGSNRRAMTRSALARLNDRLVRRRKDWVEQTSTALVRDYDVIAFEALQTKNMVRRPKPKADPDNAGQYLPNGARAKVGLNRAIHAQSWGALLSRTQNKAERASAPAVVILVDPRFTSQQCRACGHTTKENRESQADFSCVACGHIAHADVNAAENILDRALNSADFVGYAAGHAVNGRYGVNHPVIA